MALDSMIYGTGFIATHSFSEGGQTKNVERVAPGSGVLGAWGVTASPTATGLVSSFSLDTVGKGRIVVGCLCNAALATTLKFRLVFRNSANQVVGTTTEVTSTLTETTGGGSPAKRYGTITVFSNDIGASSVQMYVTTLPSGATAVDLMMAAI